MKSPEKRLIYASGAAGSIRRAGGDPHPLWRLGLGQQQVMPALQLPTPPPQSASVLQGKPQLQRQVRPPTKSGAGVWSAVAGQTWALVERTAARSRVCRRPAVA